jgi:predicted glycosyltransferase
MSHTWRALQIASHIANTFIHSSILILSDLPIIGRLKFPQNVDYVHLPGIVLGSNREYEASSLNIDVKSILQIRRKIILSVAKNFKPDVIIFDSEPHTMPGEITSTLAALREKLAQPKIVWALPDILGESRAVRLEWTRGNVYEMLERYCDEIWIFGSKHVFDPVREYEIPRALVDRLYYTSYLPPAEIFSKSSLAPTDSGVPLVMVSAGSGGKGYNLVNSYLTFLERNNGFTPVQSFVFAGPMMSSSEKRVLLERAQKLSKVTFRRFSTHFLDYLRSAQLVVSTGGYNTVCAILSCGKKAIFVPTPEPLNERRVRAKVFHNLGLVDSVAPEDLNANHLEEKVRAALATPAQTSPDSYQDMLGFHGLEKIVERIEVLRSNT